MSHNEKTPVESSNIEGVSYDPVSQTMEVDFRTGKRYRYSGVTQELYGTFMEAPSKGSYLNKVIRVGCGCEECEKP